MHLLTSDKIINLSKQPFEQPARHLDTQWPPTIITQAELNNLQQADFVLTLAQLLFSSQNQAWWLENTRLSTEQIIQSSSKSAVQKTAVYKNSSSNMTDSTSLHIWLILMLVLCFGQCTGHGGQSSDGRAIEIAKGTDQQCETGH